MSDSVFVGTKAGGLETSPQFEPISKIILLVDSENYYEAGNDTGRTLEITCPYGTQAMANNLLSSLGGYAYQPATATDALIDPAAELGDAVTVGGVYTILAQMDTTFDSLMTADIGAPGQEEIESEYPYVSQQQSDINRQIAQTRSEISKTSEEIGLRVDGLENQYAQLKVTIDGVTIEGPGGTTLINGSAVYTDNLYVDAANVKGKLTANQIDATNLKVNAANITGSLTIGQLPSNVATDSDIPTRTSDLVNDSDFQTPSGVTTIINGTVTTDYVQALGITVNAANITGTLTIGQLPSNVATDSDIPTRTSDLYNDSGYQTRTGVVSIVNGEVTADYITALGLTVNSIKLGGDMTVYRTVYSNSEGGSLGYTTSSQDGSAGIHMQSGSGEVVATSNGAKLLYGSDYNQIYVASNRCGITTQGTNYYFSSSAFNADDQPTLGSSSYLWGQIYSIRATINTSDINLKRDIEVIPDKYITMLDRLDPKRFMYKNPTSDRYHLGFIAQDVKAAMDFAGISDMEFGGWCKDVDAEGNEVQMLRYSEFIAPMLAKIKQLEARIAELEVA